MKVIVPVLEGYNKEGQPVFGQRDATADEIDRGMPVKGPRKPVQRFK